MHVLRDMPMPLTDFSGTLERDRGTMVTTLGQHTSSEIVPYAVSCPLLSWSLVARPRTGKWVLR